MTRSMSRLLAVVMLSIAASSALVAQDDEVSFDLKSKSWVKGSSFDIEHLRTLCRDGGLDLRPRDPSAPKGTRVEIEYEEKRGSGFSHFGVGNPEGWGTDITLIVRVVDGSRAPTIALSLAAETPAGLEIEQFHQGARDALKRSPGYRLACDAIRGALGHVDSQRRLLPWAIFDARPLGVLTTLRFQSGTPDEEAYLALARRDFTRIRTLGDAGAEPLILLLDSSVEDRGGYGTFPADSTERTTVLANAVEALTALDNEERSVEVLMGLLNDYALARDEQPEAHPLLVTVLKKLGAIGTRFSLPLIDEYARGSSPLAQEAKQAAAAIRRRVEF